VSTPRAGDDLGTSAPGQSGDSRTAVQGVLQQVALVLVVQTLELEAVDEGVHGVLVVGVHALDQSAPGQEAGAVLDDLHAVHLAVPEHPDGRFALGASATAGQCVKFRGSSNLLRRIMTKAGKTNVRKTSQGDEIGVYCVADDGFSCYLQTIMTL